MTATDLPTSGTLMRRRASTSLLAVLVLVLATLITAPAAQAVSRDGRCDSGEFCYYYNSDNQGSISDFTTSVGDYGTEQPSRYDFKGEGRGKGRCIKNDAASVWNRTGKSVRVHYNSNYGGTSQAFEPGAKRNLNKDLYNNNASHKIGVVATECRTDGTNTRLPSTILVYRTQLDRVDRVIFKTYVKNVLPNEWKTSWPRESLKAGAMATKSFGWYWALHSTRETSGGQCFDVYDSTSSQVYRPGSAVESTNRAVNQTWDTRMTRDGSILQAHYCSTTTACGAWVPGDWMSQYGSRDLARNGRSYREILHRYYDGIRLPS